MTQKRVIRWRDESGKNDENGIPILFRADPIEVGPLTVDAWFKFDNETRRGRFVQVWIGTSFVTLFEREQSTRTAEATATVQRLIEEGLNESYQEIERLCEEAEVRVRTLVLLRANMHSVMLRHGTATQKLTREIAYLVLLINHPNVKGPSRVEQTGPDSAVAFDEQGRVIGRIRYDPTNPINHRAAGRDSRGYYGFFEETVQPRPGEEVSQ